MPDGPTLSFDRHQTAFARMASTSKKDLVTLWRQEARICFGGTASMPGVAGITPPYGEGKLQNASSAEKHAKAKVASDIHALYGTPSQAYDAIHEKNPADADAFWYLRLHHDTRGASDILRQNTGSWLAPFDDGKYHRQNFRKKNRRIRFYVTDPKALSDYIKLEQGLIWWLASGWHEPLEALDARLPAGIKRHPSPGHLEVNITADDISISAVNEVSYGSSIRDMNRRLQTVMNDYRVQRLDRAWEHYLDVLAKRHGLKKE
ncbi:hypothetical protein [Prosthecobacter sp.]|uniref:hypothetical protein n=1 Tax=Prosthecobacter sp. TaxID=1965333 RepID=UPI003783D41C